MLRVSGVLTQLACAGCLLLGTIAFVLVQQNTSDGSELAIAWGAGAMAGLVCGGLMARGGLIAVLGSAVISAAFGGVLFTLDREVLRAILRVLSADDVAMLADVLFGIAVAMVSITALCIASIPQALRYGRWLRDGAEAERSASTERGFPPPPVSASATGSMWRAPAAPPAEIRSRRRLYIAMMGFAIGCGAGIGVLVSSTSRGSPGVSTTPGSGTATVGAALPDAGTSTVKPIESRTGEPPLTSVLTLLQAQRDALGRGDVKALIASVAPEAVGFGANADELAEGRDAIEAQLRRNLGDPTGPLTIEERFSQTGEEQNHAWTAQDLVISGSGRRTQRFAVTQLAAWIDGSWRVVAWHWGVPVRDSDAERVALLGTKPAPKAVANKLAGPKELDAAVRAAFGSRRAFMESRSDREDGFNFGSGPNERLTGSQIKRVFKTSKSEVRLHDGVHAVAGSAWDPAQRAAPWIGFAVANVDLTVMTRARTELTQTFRVLAVLLKEGNDWKVVQAQFSHGGPIR